MIKELKKTYSKEYSTWDHFRVIKKYTFLPLRIYQYTSQRTWWSWLETTYVLQDWKYVSFGSLNIMKHLKSYFFGGYWKNCRLSNEEEYKNYLNSK